MERQTDRWMSVQMVGTILKWGCRNNEKLSGNLYLRAGWQVCWAVTVNILDVLFLNAVLMKCFMLCWSYVLIGSLAWFYDTLLIQPRAHIFPFCFNYGIWINCLSICDSLRWCTGGGSMFICSQNGANFFLSKCSHQGQSTGRKASFTQLRSGQ